MKDDRKYRRLMAEYKTLRMDPEKKREAQKLLDAAQELARNGQVSDDAIIGMAYL